MFWTTTQTTTIQIFNSSFEQVICLEEKKTARVIPILKTADEKDSGNYRTILVPPCSSIILKQIMYEMLYKYLVENNIIYKKQLGFQKKHSTEHGIIKLIDTFDHTFENSNFTLGVFIDVSKAFISCKPQNTNF